MALKYASLGSGSSGNATVVAHVSGSETQAILVDCGFSARETERRLSRLNIPMSSIKGILVTHEHADHAKGVATLAKRYDLPVYMSQGTCIAGEFESLLNLRFIRADINFRVAEFDIMPVTVAHDAREPLQFVIRSGNSKLGILTDLGSVTENVIAAYSDCTGLLVEANHDLELLARGPYPLSLQRRVGGAWGHLNNKQCLDLLTQLDTGSLKCLVIGHISQKNNDINLVKQTLQAVTHSIPELHYACQSDGFPWLDA